MPKGTLKKGLTKTMKNADIKIEERRRCCGR